MSTLEDIREELLDILDERYERIEREDVREQVQKILDVREEVQKILDDRHKRIKAERRSLLTTIMGLSGGAIILSMTMIEKIGPQKVGIWSIVAAWGFFALSLLHALFCLYRMTRLSVLFQAELMRLIDRDYEKEFRTTPSVGTLGRRYAISPTHKFSCGEVPGVLVSESGSGLLFVVGTIFLGIFALLNLIAG